MTPRPFKSHAPHFSLFLHLLRLESSLLWSSDPMLSPWARKAQILAPFHYLRSSISSCEEIPVEFEESTTWKLQISYANTVVASGRELESFHRRNYPEIQAWNQIWRRKIVDMFLEPTGVADPNSPQVHLELISWTSGRKI